MTSAAAIEDTKNSILYILDQRMATNQPPTAREIKDAIKQDLDNILPLGRAIFAKLVLGNRAFTQIDLRELLGCLKIALITSLDHDPEIALTYMHAACLCVKELEAKEKGLKLVV